MLKNDKKYPFLLFDTAQPSDVHMAFVCCVLLWLAIE